MRAFVKPVAGPDHVEPADVPTPQIDPDELLIRVHVVGVGIHDSYFLPEEPNYPYPIGIEAAGVVEEVGSDTGSHKPGDRVAFVSSMQPKGGTWAEYAAVKSSSLIVPVPEAMEFTAAAAVPVAGNTILRALHALKSVPDGGSIFIAGASGAIGTLAIQIARARGWRVSGSASPQNHEFMRALGAEHTVDYHDSVWPDQVLTWMPGGVDAAIAVQPGTSDDSMRVVRDGGKLVSISGDQLAPERGISAEMVPYDVDVSDELVRMLELIASGGLRVEIKKIYPFSDALSALAKVQTRHARGKVVLNLE